MLLRLLLLILKPVTKFLSRRNLDFPSFLRPPRTTPTAEKWHRRLGLSRSANALLPAAERIVEATDAEARAERVEQIKRATLLENANRHAFLRALEEIAETMAAAVYAERVSAIKCVVRGELVKLHVFRHAAGKHVEVMDAAARAEHARAIRSAARPAVAKRRVFPRAVEKPVEATDAAVHAASAAQNNFVTHRTNANRPVHVTPYQIRDAPEAINASPFRTNRTSA